MPLSPGTRLGPYEVIAPIGAGGMGEVHKARDTRLNRIVAIKKSLAPFDERFEREAHAIASLNHPHICALYDVGPDYLVMEYVEGKQLAGPVELDEALVLAKQILDAIEAAHRKGIVHRDLKPANILVTKAGVKLLDFGLAKASAELTANLATIGGPATGAGTIVGTLQYMSPEQVEGREADARSDIFAFGLVLYELITGRRVFDGPSSASVVAAILKDQPPPVSHLCPVTPKMLDRVVQTCLEKDPDERWQSAREVRHALEWMTLDAVNESEAPERMKAGSRSIRLWQGATVLALLAAAGGAMWANRPAQAPVAEQLRFHIAPPADAAFDTYVALSPDGQRLVFSARGADGTIRLWLRDLTSIEPRILPGTEGAQSAFWAPDSRHLAFGFRNQLKKIDVAGGPPEILCEVAAPVGSGAWNYEGIILFGSRGVGGLNRVSESGGAATAVTSAEGGFSSFPSFLPGGRRFIYYRRIGPVFGIFAGSLDEKPEGQPTTPVLLTDAAGAYVRLSNPDAGYMLFVRDATLMAQAFDDRTLTFSGDAVPIDRVATVNNYPAFSASANGRLAYRAGGRSASHQLTWFTREGKPLSTVGDRGGHEQLALSPDGAHAVYRDVVGTVAGDLWMADLTRGISARFTFEPALGGFPVWSPDGRRVAFQSGSDIFQKQASGGGDAELLFHSLIQTSPSSWSRDGRFLLITTIGSENRVLDIQVLPLTGDRKPVPFLETQHGESQARFSPDGRWVAYTSNESRRSEVYVRPFTVPGAAPTVDGKWQVSRNGGNTPAWRDDGRELIFRSLPGSPMGVDVKPMPTTFHAGIPRQLFPIPPVPWAVTGDGQRFLVSMPPPGGVQAPITVVLNWEAGLKP
jgi:Tol biopolymer transport system component/predicted Ser/Thr protein kinase